MSTLWGAAKKVLKPIVVGRLGLSQIELGIAESIVLVTAVAAACVPIAMAIPPPSAALLSQLADIGAVLVLAYVVEAVWLIPRMAKEKDYERRLGAIAGLGIAGMLGVVFAVLLSAHRAAGHTNFLDDMAFAWVVPSLAILAGMVIVHPLLVHEWRDPEKEA